METDSKKTVLVFGVFDILHDGHRYFLNEAKKLGERLLVAVASDSSVKLLKNNLPHHDLETRIDNLKKENIADEIIPGDESIGSWDILKTVKPQIVAIGYDQNDLEKSLSNFISNERQNIEIVKIKPHENGELHSSVLRKNIV